MSSCDGRCGSCPYDDQDSPCPEQRVQDKEILTPALPQLPVIFLEWRGSPPMLAHYEGRLLVTSDDIKRIKFLTSMADWNSI